MFKALFRIFDYSGRSTRWEYWSYYIGLTLVIIVAGAGVAAFEDGHGGQLPTLDDDVTGFVSLAFLALIGFPGLALKVRRYHDFGWSGWSVLWSVVPLVNVFMEFMLLFRGPAPEPVAIPSWQEPQRINIYNTPSAGLPAQPEPATHVAQIERLASMHSQGMLTAHEFAAAKGKVLRQ